MLVIESYICGAVVYICISVKYNTLVANKMIILNMNVNV